MVVQANYFPKLFGDEDLTFAKKLMMNRITLETRAKLLTVPSNLLEKAVEAANAAAEAASAAESEPKPKKQASIENMQSRFKFAFVDTSLPKAQRRVQIRTRTGE